MSDAGGRFSRCAPKRQRLQRTCMNDRDTYLQQLKQRESELAWTSMRFDFNRIEELHRSGQEAWNVGSGSVLDAADALTEPHQVSHLLGYLLHTAVDHLHALKTLLADAETQHKFAPYTLIRGSIEQPQLLCGSSKTLIPDSLHEGLCLWRIRIYGIKGAPQGWSIKTPILTRTLITPQKRPRSKRCNHRRGQEAAPRQRDDRDCGRRLRPARFPFDLADVLSCSPWTPVG